MATYPLLQQILLLLEREALNRLNYGYWIDTHTGKLQPVDFQGHLDYIKGNEGELIKRLQDPSLQGLKGYRLGFASGLVRIIHNPFGTTPEFGVAGIRDHIKKAITKIAPSVIPFFGEHGVNGTFTVEIFNNTDEVQTKVNGQQMSFNDPRKALQFLRSL